MEVAGRLFRNCLGSRVSQVRMGFSYYYQLGEIGVVEMERVSNLGWEITEAAGRRNATLAPDALVLLQSALTNLPAHISPVLSDQIAN